MADTMHTENKIEQTRVMAFRLASLLGGLALGFSYPPIGLFPLAWVALVPVLVGTRLLNRRDSFINAWLFFLATYVVAFGWPLFHERTDTAFISGLAWLALTLCLSIPFGLASRVSLRWPGVNAAWAAGLFLLLLEHLLRSGPVPMPWSALAHSQSTVDLTVRASVWIGASGVSTLVILTNLCLAQVFFSSGTSRWRYFFTAAGLPTVLSLLGAFSQIPISTRNLTLAALQPGNSPSSWANVNDLSRVDTLLSASTALLDTTDIAVNMVIWPETALPILPANMEESDVIRKISDWTSAHQVALLTGAITTATSNRNARRPGFQNSAILFAQDGTVQVVSKNILVPFAEFVPFSNLFSFMRVLATPAGGVSGYLPGRKPSVMSIDGINMGVLICFESIFPAYARQLVSNGSEILIVLTQDGWWRSNRASAQHLAFGKFRAAESGRSVVQVSVDGLTGTIRADGRVMDQTDTRTRASRVYQIPLFTGTTFYGRYGDLWNWIFMGIWCSFLVFQGFHSRQLPR